MFDFIGRVLVRLQEQERVESDRWRREDYRQSWAAIYKLHAGQFPDFWSAFIDASYQRYGLHPDRVWPAIVEQRHALLGSEYSVWYDKRDVLIPEILDDMILLSSASIERKPVQSERRLPFSVEAESPAQLMLWAMPEQLKLWCENTNGARAVNSHAA